MADAVAAGDKTVVPVAAVAVVRETPARVVAVDVVPALVMPVTQSCQ